MKKIFIAIGVSLFFFIYIAGQASARPIACWDLNSNHECDPLEDINKDGKCNPRDCDVVEESCYGVPKTGQTTSYGTGDDGALEKGLPWL